jgi:hypothetical protein
MRIHRIVGLIVVAVVTGCGSGTVIDSRHPKAETMRGSSWTASSAGPRVGVIYIADDDVAQKMWDDYGLERYLGAFGWQFEYQYSIEDAPVTGLIELVPFGFGLEQGAFLPSMNALVGFRTDTNWEAALGPNLSISGIGMTYTIGKTLRIGELNLPVNIAVVSGENGLRYSFTIGGNLATF